MKKAKYRLIFFRQIFTVICIFLMLTTGLSSIYASESIFEKNNSPDEEKSNLMDSAKDKIDDALKSTKSKLSDMKDTLSKFKDKINIKNLTESIPTFTNFLLTNSKSNTSFRFYTNYNGNENSTEIKFFRTVKIDINDDTKEDISARYIIYPSFDLRSFSLAINVRLIIRKLKDFPDENASFDAFLEFYFPSLGLLKNLSSNRIRFGYESPKDEQIPKRCVVTYKFLPNLLKPHKKMEHKLSIRPGGITRESKIVLLFSSTQFKNKNIFSEEKYRIVFNPATNTAITIGGNKKSDEPNFEFEKASFTKSIIDIYFSYMKNETYTYLYCLGVPKHLLLTLKHGKQGYVEFDSFGDPIEEVGICDDIKNPKNKLFFAEFPKKARMSWSRDLFPPVQLKLNLYSEGEGIKLGSHLSLPNSGIKDLDFIINSHETLDFNLDLDMKNGYLEIDRSNSSLSLYIDVNGINGSTFTGSMDIKRFTKSPFRLFYDRIIDGEGGLETYISGKKLEIRNLHLRANSSIIGGILKVDIDSCLIGPKYKEKVSKMSFNISLKLRSANVYARVCLNVIRGIKITNPVIQYNDLKITPGDIDISGNRSFCYEFLLNGTIEFDFGDNFSWGYIKLYGAAAFLIDGTFERNGKKGGVYGLISLKSYKGSLNISWHTEIIDENETRVFNVKGAALLALKDFHIWFADILDINIPSFNGSLILENASRKSGNLSLDLKGIGSKSSFEHMGFNFSSTGIIETSKDLIINITMKNITRKSGRIFSASWDLSWSNYTVSDFSLNYSGNRYLSIEYLNISIKNNYSNFSFVSDRLVFNGSVDFEFNSSDFGDITIFDGPILRITTTDSKIDAHIKILSIPGIVNVVNLSIDSETIGTASLSFFEKLSYEYLNESLYPNAKNLNLSRLNMTFLGFYADNGIFNLNLLEFSLNLPILSSLSESIPIIGIILGLLTNLDFKMENRSLKNGNSFKSFSMMFVNLSDFIQNLTQNKNLSFQTLINIAKYLAVECLLNGGFNFKVENQFRGPGKYYSKMDSFYLDFLDITIREGLKLAKEFGLLDKNFSLPNGKYANSSFTFFIKNFTMSEGIFNLNYEGFTGAKFDINKNSSFFGNTDIGIGFKDIFYALLSFEGSFDNLLFEYNKGINNQSDLKNGNYTTTYFLIDTDNKTASLPDMEVWVESDFINFATELLKNRTGISLPKAKSDIGIRFFNNLTFRADKFKITTFTNNTSNKTWWSNTGYLYAETGDIWIFYNNKWTQIAGGNISILVEPGHLKLYLDEDIGIPGMTWQLEEGTNFSISGSFFVGLSNVTIDIWWDLVNGSYLVNASGGGSGNFNLGIRDFYMKLTKEWEINRSNISKINSLSLSIEELSVAGGGSFNLYASNLTKKDSNNSSNNTKALDNSTNNATLQLDIDALIFKFDVKNLDFSASILIPGKNESNETLVYRNISISGSLDLSLGGDISFKTNFTTWQLIIEEGTFGLGGSIPLSIIGNFFNLSLSGEVDFSVSGGGSAAIVISGSNLFDFANLSYDVMVSPNALAEFTLSNFEVNLERKSENKSVGSINISGKKFGGNLGGSGSISFSSKNRGKINLTVTSFVFGIYAEDVTVISTSYNNTNNSENIKGFYLDGEFYFDISIEGYIKITADISDITKPSIDSYDSNITITGYGKLRMNDASIIVIQGINETGGLVKGLTISCKNLQLNGYGGFINTVFEVHNKTHKWTETYTRAYFEVPFVEMDQLTASFNNFSPENENLSAINFTVDGEITMSAGAGGAYIEFEDPLESVDKNKSLKIGVSTLGGSFNMKGTNPYKPFSITSDIANLSFDEATLSGSGDLEIRLHSPNIIEDKLNAIEFVQLRGSTGECRISNLNASFAIGGSLNESSGNVTMDLCDFNWYREFNLSVLFPIAGNNENITSLELNFTADSGPEPAVVLDSLSIEAELDLELENTSIYANGYFGIDTWEANESSYIRGGISIISNEAAPYYEPYIEFGGKHKFIKSIEIILRKLIWEQKELDLSFNFSVNNITNNGRKLYFGALFHGLPSDLKDPLEWLEHNENITIGWLGSFSYKNISLSIMVNNSHIKIPIINYPVFTGRVIGGASVEGAGEITIGLNGSQIFPVILEGHCDKAITLTMVDIWREPLGLFDLKLGTVELSKGSFKISLMIDQSNPGNFGLVFESSCNLNISLLKASYAGDKDIEIDILGIEFYGNSWSINVHYIDLYHTTIEFSTLKRWKWPSFDLIKIKVDGKNILETKEKMSFTCPYLFLGWNIEQKETAPWIQGDISLDTKGNIVTLPFYIYIGDPDFMRICGTINAEDFYVSFGGYHEESGWLGFYTNGSLKLGCIIDLNVNGEWIRLIGSDNNPPTKPQTPDGPASGQSGQSLTYSTSSTDPDGDEIKYGWDWNNDGVVEWWVTSKSRSHIWYNNGEKTYSIRVKAKDEYGLESEWSDSFDVTISGGVTGSWKSPIDHNDPESDWEDEDKAYDDGTSTCAISKQCSRIPKWVWTEPLEIVFHNGPVGNCPEVGKIRFKAWHHPEWCEKVDINAYRYNEYSNKWEWVYLYHGKYYDHEDDWNVIHHQHTYSLKIKKVRLKFYVKETWNGGQGISADLYELDYWKINE